VQGLLQKHLNTDFIIATKLHRSVGGQVSLPRTSLCTWLSSKVFAWSAMICDTEVRFLFSWSFILHLNKLIYFSIWLKKHLIFLASWIHGISLDFQKCVLQRVPRCQVAKEPLLYFQLMAKKPSLSWRKAELSCCSVGHACLCSAIVVCTCKYSTWSGLKGGSKFSMGLVQGLEIILTTSSV